MSTTVTGPIGATYDAVFDGISATLTRVGGVVGYAETGGAIAPDQKTYVTSGGGVLTMEDLKPGRYTLSLSVPISESTAQTKLWEASGTVPFDAGVSLTLEEFLEVNAEPLTPSLVQQAIAAAALSQAWAESPTPPDPDDATSKSSKTWAGEAADSASTATTQAGIATTQAGNAASSAAEAVVSRAQSEINAIASAYRPVSVLPDLPDAGNPVGSYALLQMDRGTQLHQNVADEWVFVGWFLTPDRAAAGAGSAAFVETWTTGWFGDTPDNSPIGAPGLQISVTGTRGSNVLTTADSALVAGLGSDPWDGALNAADQSDDFFVGVTGNNGADEIYLLHPLTEDFSGHLTNKFADSLHLSPGATKAYARHVARKTAREVSRGGIMDGSWLDLPSRLQTAWARNAALVAHGVSTTESVTTSLVAGVGSLASQTNGIVRRISASAESRVFVGTHEAGHGMSGTFQGRGRDVALEFWTGAYAGDLDAAEAEILVTVTHKNQPVYTDTVGRRVHRHYIEIPTAGEIVVSITNQDGSVYNIEVNQCRLQEAGKGGRIIRAGQRVVTIGDSWFTRYDGQFARTLALETGAEVINRSLSSTTIEYAIAWFEDHVARYRPDVVIAHFFSNDRTKIGDPSSGLMTFTGPDGSEVTNWPADKTGDVGRDYYAERILLFCALAQSRGIQPVVIMSGLSTPSINITQPSAERNSCIDRRNAVPLGWIATPQQATDPESFINRVGKYAGSKITVGQSVRTATGASPTDTWVNTAEQIGLSIQQTIYTLSEYAAAPDFTIGTDTSEDGLSDGLDYQTFGTLETEGETFTPSIVAVDGVNIQRYVCDFRAGNTGSKRIRGLFTGAEIGDEYIVVLDCDGPASTNADFIQNLSGGYSSVAVENRTFDAAGSGPLFARQVADKANPGFGVMPARSNGNVRTIDLKRAILVNLTELFAVAPNLLNFTDRELAVFALGIKTE